MVKFVEENLCDTIIIHKGGRYAFGMDEFRSVFRVGLRANSYQFKEESEFITRDLIQ